MCTCALAVLAALCAEKWTISLSLGRPDLGWAAKMPLREGIAETYRWFRENISG